MAIGRIGDVSIPFGWDEKYHWCDDCQPILIINRYNHRSDQPVVMYWTCLPILYGICGSTLSSLPERTAQLASSLVIDIHVRNHTRKDSTKSMCIHQKVPQLLTTNFMTTFRQLFIHKIIHHNYSPKEIHHDFSDDNFGGYPSRWSNGLGLTIDCPWPNNYPQA